MSDAFTSLLLNFLRLGNLKLLLTTRNGIGFLFYLLSLQNDYNIASGDKKDGMYQCATVGSAQLMCFCKQLFDKR